MQSTRTLSRILNFSKCFTRRTHYSCILAPKIYNKVPPRPVSKISRLDLSSTVDVDGATFEKACEETLESLTEYFEQIVEENDSLRSGDVSYSSGVLTVNLGPRYGTYVINRQSPNKQIWLSSPISGPKRYDFVVEDLCWVYRHDGRSLHALLQSEFSQIVSGVNFAHCSYSKL